MFLCIFCFKKSKNTCPPCRRLQNHIFKNKFGAVFRVLRQVNMQHWNVLHNLAQHRECQKNFLQNHSTLFLTTNPPPPDIPTLAPHPPPLSAPSRISSGLNRIKYHPEAKSLTWWICHQFWTGPLSWSF